MREQLIKAIDYAIDTDNKIYFNEKKNRERILGARTICVFGTGAFYIGYKHFLDKVDYVCDSNPEKWGKVFCGCMCISPQELFMMKDVAVIIMVSQYREIKKMLDDNNINNCYFGDLYSNVYTEYHNGEWFAKQKKDILKVYDLLKDKESRRIYSEVICLRTAPQYAMNIFGELETYGEYFNTGIINLTEHEVLVDAGAYNGDSIIDFIKTVNGRYDKIYAFELEKNNYLEMKKNLKPYDVGKMVLYNYGTSDKNRLIKCSGNGVDVRVTDSGEIAELVQIDKMINEKVTYIKMDVEGAEQKSLDGASKIISSYYPKMCISAYHMLEDLWQIPLKILKFSDDYRIYMRHHSPLAWDTDCYALPDKEK